MKYRIGIVWIVLVLIASSCNKEAGVGGSATLRGKVHARYYNDLFTAYLGAAYAPDQEVYIICGDDFTYTDRVRTNYDGSYEFSYLRKGTYKVYAYSKDSTFTVPAGKFAVVQEVEITKGNEELLVPDIEILD
jgi:hypothetical protein